MARSAASEPAQATTQDAILAASLRLFHAVGYHGTTMRGISKDAGITLGSIYHHFESKQQILQHIMTAILDDLVVSARASLAQAGPRPAERLTALVTSWIQFHSTRIAEAVVGSSEIRSLDDEGRRIVVGQRDEIEQMFRDVVEDGVRTREFGTPYPVEATRAIVNMGASVAAWYRPGGPLGIEEMAQRYCRLALATVEVARPA